MKVEFDFQGENLEVDISEDAKEAIQRENEFILYTYLSQAFFA